MFLLNLSGASCNFPRTRCLLAVLREPDATWVIPSEDEWHKAAYHKNDGVTGNYFNYPTSSDSTPSNDVTDPDADNNANFEDDDGGYTIGSPYYRTEVGEFENSESPYGTFDQGGNVWEWDEAILYGLYRGLRGGSFSNYVIRLHAASRGNCGNPLISDRLIGFRVAEILAPIPTLSEWGFVAMTLLVLTAGTLVFVRRRQAA